MKKNLQWFDPYKEPSDIRRFSTLRKPIAEGGLLTRQVIKSICVVLLVLVSQSSFAQRIISGVIKDNEGETLPGVTIIVKGTTIGTVTNLDGKYTLEIPTENKPVLIFSFVGYKEQEISVGERSVIDVALEVDVKSLDEVVVIGYGSQKRSEISNAIASVSAENFLVGKIQDASDLIKGKVAGLVITKGSGDPNANSNIVLRGINSFQGGTSPLILVDGIPADMNMVAPESIESISVLKDGASAAIYGTRGANGVILITTKSAGKNQRAKVSYTGYTSFSNFLKVPDFMDAADVRAKKTTFTNDKYETDWLGAVTQTGFTHRHVVDVSGGSKSTTYTANASYKYEDGTILKSNSEQTKVQLGVNQYFFDDKITVGVKLWKDYRTNTATDASQNGPSNIYRQAIIRNPTSPIYTSTGEYNEDFNKFQYYNPVAIINELDGERVIDRTTMIGTLGLEPIKNWKTSLMVSQYNYNENLAYYKTSEHYSSKTSGIPGSASQSYGRDRTDVMELTSEYNYDIQKHGFTAMIGHSRYYNVYQGFNADNSGFDTDLTLYNNLGSGIRLKDGKASMGSYKHDDMLISYFARFHYGYADKYHLMASVRKEGSSKFGASEKWGVFPAVSAGWTISEESFLKNVTFVNNLKLRVGYGVTGRIPTGRKGFENGGENSGSYKSILKYTYATSYGNFLNASGQWVPALSISQSENPHLKWETNVEWNFGLDFALLKNRISGSIDAFQKSNNDFLYNYRIPNPPYPTNRFDANAGTLRNRGLELLLNGTPVQTKNFEWNTTLTLSKFRTKMIKFGNDIYESDSETNVGGFGDPISVTSHRVVEGEILGRFWGLKSVGVSDGGLWLIEDPNTGEAIEYSTSLNNDTYRQFLGNGYPKLYLGLNNSFRYKKFDLNIQASGQFGFQIINEQRVFYQNNSIQYNKLKSAAEPVYGKRPLSTAQAQAFVSYFVEDGDFLKFDNVTLGYNMKLMPQYIQTMRLYLSVQNFLILTKYSGLDPELTNSDPITPGFDPRDKYPTIKSLTVGLNLIFK
jgi:TonB-dependent starch-binding outer membrane protein SusC